MADKNVIRVLDFSGCFSPEKMLFPERIVRTWNFEWIDFRDLGGTMCFCSEESAAEIRRRLDGNFGGELHWIDTGDYHYLTYFFLERLTVPFTLLLLDNHPDDQPSVFGGDLLSCGGWVLAAMEQLPMLRKVVSVGPDGALTVRERRTGPSGEGTWRVVYEADLYDGENKLRLLEAETILREIITEGESVYLSLDKDVLSNDFARTDWSQGKMSLPDMLRLLQVLRGRKLLGMDICGGLTEAKGATEGDFSINARTDAALLEALAPLAAERD